MEQTELTSAELGLLHDAELCSLEIDRANALLRLHFREIPGSISTTLSCRGVLWLRVSDVRMQNVVYAALLSGVSPRLDADLAGILR
jgi:hypothetical protein